MSLKPFTEVVDSKVDKKSEKIEPYVDEASGGVQIDDIQHSLNEKEEILEQSSSIFSSFSTFIKLLILLFIVTLVADSYKSVIHIYADGSYIDVFYLISASLVLISLSLLLYKNYTQVRVLTRVTAMQEAFKKQAENPDTEIIVLSEKLLDTFAQNSDTLLVERSNVLRERMGSSHEYKEIYKELDEKVLEVLDTKVKKRIKLASTQAALSTAISPLALLDTAIILWRSMLLTKEIATIYGFKPGYYASAVLLKRGMKHVFFAGVAELGVEYISESTHSSFISKLSLSAGEGVTNGILMARLGYGVMSACRVMPMREKRETFVVGILGSIKGYLLKKES